MTYRPELDGVRGVAILLVLAAHIHLPWTEGAGPVGVTLFFVLSGYLITSLLLAEHGATGAVSLRAFYERRVRRLLPALVAVLVAASVVMAALGRGAEYPAQALPVLLYFGNVTRSAGQDLGMLGHTWSLSLEEQFYLLWPALFIVAPRWALVPILAAGLAVSLIAQVALAADPLAAYRPDVRADAILWGCLLAIRPMAFGRWPALGWFALVVLVPLPGPFAAASVASLLIVAHPPRWLAWAPLVRVGQVSYGLYLWHMLPAWLLWDRTLAGDVPAMVAVVIAAFGLAFASERWIERPFRQARRSSAQSGDWRGSSIPSHSHPA